MPQYECSEHGHNQMWEWSQYIPGQSPFRVSVLDVMVQLRLPHIL